MDGDRLLDALGNEHARAVLAETVDEPRSVDDLTRAIGASQPTVYRQVETLCELDLLEERHGYDDGTHYQTYLARVERLELELTRDGFVVAAPDRSEGSGPVPR